MPNIENIEKHKFKKGQSGNPEGKKIGTKNRATILKQFLSAKIDVKNPETGELEKKTFEEAIELAILNKANNGDVIAYKEIKDTIYGKIAENHNIAGELKGQGTTILYFTEKERKDDSGKKADSSV
jgi:hypothetical protein